MSSGMGPVLPDTLLRPPPASSRLRALVVTPAWVGDTVMAQVLFMRLHDHIPNLQLDALSPRWVAPVLERMPEIHAVIDSPFVHGELALAARRQLASRLKQAGYRRAYILPNSLKSSLVPYLAGIPERIGFTGEARYGLINRRHRLNEAELPQMVERFAQLAEAPGAPLPRPLPQPHLRSSEAQQAATLNALGIERPEKVAVFCPGAEYGPAKRWPARHFGLMHVAAALGRPLVAVYGSSSPGFTPPLSAHAKIVSLQLECSPCFKRECPLGHLDCLNKLDPQRVLEACRAGPSS